jgi:alkanesulfonate monooxygenase
VLEPFADPAANPRTVAEIASSAEAGGVDRVLIGYGSATPDGWPIAAYALSATTHLQVLVAHRPGVMHPVTAARLSATQQYLSGGRLALNVVSGGSPGDQLREGDDLAKEERYKRASEYMDIMKMVWAAESPVDFTGEFYKLSRAFLMQRPQTPVPIFMGGASDAALEFGVDHADTYMLWGEPLAATAERVAGIESAARDRGRPRPRISTSLRLIQGATSEEAWNKADAIAEKLGGPRTPRHMNDAGRQRQLEIAQENLRHDSNFWTGIMLATGGMGNTSALVGTPDELVASLGKYRELGIDTLLLTGPDGRWDDKLAAVIQRLRRELA